MRNAEIIKALDKQLDNPNLDIETRKALQKKKDILSNNKEVKK